MLRTIIAVAFIFLALGIMDEATIYERRGMSGRGKKLKALAWLIIIGVILLWMFYPLK